MWLLWERSKRVADGINGARAWLFLPLSERLVKTKSPADAGSAGLFMECTVLVKHVNLEQGDQKERV
jgi:hypothetical protein